MRTAYEQTLKKNTFMVVFCVLKREINPSTKINNTKPSTFNMFVP